MKKIGLVCVFVFVAAPAFAQPIPQTQNPQLSVCQQLLANANSQTINVAAESVSLNKQIEDLKAEIAKLKSEQPKDK